MYTGTQTAYHCKYTPVQVWFRIKYYTIRTTNGILNIRQRQQVITHWNNLFNWCLKFKLFCIPKCVKRNLKKNHISTHVRFGVYISSHLYVLSIVQLKGEDECNINNDDDNNNNNDADDKCYYNVAIMSYYWSAPVFSLTPSVKTCLLSSSQQRLNLWINHLWSIVFTPSVHGWCINENRVRAGGCNNLKSAAGRESSLVGERKLLYILDMG